MQFHFHSPSEHRIQGRACPLEMHIVHNLVEGGPHDYKYTKAVLAVLFDDALDIPSPFLESLHPEIPEVSCNVNLQPFLESIPKHLYHYEGSLTTPPCSEIVNWYCEFNTWVGCSSWSPRVPPRPRSRISPRYGNTT